MSDNLNRSQDILAFFIKSSCALLRKCPNLNLSLREIKLLHFLEESKANSIRVSTLSDKMELTMPATSKLLKILESKDLIVRTADIKDRRIIIVSITKHGSDMLRQVLDYFTESIDSVVLRMGAKNADEFIELSKCYLSALQEAGFLKEKEDVAC